MDWTEIAPSNRAWHKGPEACGGCGPCAAFLGYLIRGWDLPGEGTPVGEEERRLLRKREKILRNRRQGRRAYHVEVDGDERLLRCWDPPELWKRAGVPERTVADVFPSNSGGRPPLHPHLDPETLDTILTDVEAWLSHLEGLSLESVREHVGEVYPEPSPPHLSDVLDVLEDRWSRSGDELSEARRAYERRGTARHVSAVLPIEVAIVPGRGGWESVRVTYRDNPFTPAQLEGIDRKRRRQQGESDGGQ